MAKKKKKRRRGLKVGICVCVLVALLLALLGFDIGGFGGQLGFPTLRQAEGEAEVTQPDTEEPADVIPPEEEANDTEEDEFSFVISVSGDVILHGEQRLSIDQLRTLLLEWNQPTYLWELRDEQAIMAVYEEVRMLFVELDLAFIETAG